MALSLDSLITQVVKTEEDPEDILASSIPLLFPHAAHNQHGNPGETLTYTSPPAQPIKLHLSDPVADEDRRLFAHYVWNASIFLAEAIGNGSWFRNLGEDSRCRQDDWSVKGEKILELGAGTGLASILSSHHSATSVTCTDYPSPELISTLSRTVKDNTATITSATPVTVAGHKWGEFELAESQDCAHPLSTPNSYTRILAADTLWMMGEHEALAQSMAHFLQRTNDSKVWVVAGFHTGRAKVAAFFAEVSKVGLVVRRRWEVDVNGCEREWIDERQGEGPGMAARWIVVAILGWMEPRETF